MTERDSDSYEATRKRRWRGHQEGFHGHCDNVKCPTAMDVYKLNEDRLLAIALFDELANQGKDAKKFFGDFYNQFRSDADYELPEDFRDNEDEYPHSPDMVHRIKAKSDIRCPATLLIPRDQTW